MNNTNMNWKFLTLDFNKEIYDALLQQHHAAQFIAMLGRHLIPQQLDDSNTNMQYLPGSGLLAGNEFSNGLRLALHLSDLKLCFIDQAENCKNKIFLAGKSKKLVFEELKKALINLGLDVSKFKDELHYEIPTHKLDKGSFFSVNDKSLFQENAFYRHNAEIVINKIARGFDDAEPVRIWPHHFDTGTLLPVVHNEKGGLSKSIGLGWAIPDGMVGEPYYYLSFWSEKLDDNLKSLPALSAGQWMTPDWNGAVLKHSDIQKQESSEKQFELVESFYNRGIEILLTNFTK